MKSSLRTTSGCISRQGGGKMVVQPAVEAACFVEATANPKLAPVIYMPARLRDRPVPAGPLVSMAAVPIGPTCPRTCPFKSADGILHGCYAEAGFTKFQNLALERAAQGHTVEGDPGGHGLADRPCLRRWADSPRRRPRRSQSTSFSVWRRRLVAGSGDHGEGRDSLSSPWWRGDLDLFALVARDRPTDLGPECRGARIDRAGRGHRGCPSRRLRIGNRGAEVLLGKGIQSPRLKLTHPALPLPDGGPDMRRVPVVLRR